MKLSRIEHGVDGVIGILDYIAAGDDDQVEGNWYEVIGETADGRDACSEFSITQVMAEASATISDALRQQDQLGEALRDLAEEAEEFARVLPPYQNSEALAKARAALKRLEEE